MSAPKIIKGYIPGVIGRIAELHINYYHPSWNFGSYFESKVARDMADFMDRYDKARDGLWAVMQNGRIQGAIAIDGLDVPDPGAHLRWFILSENLRGQGLGNSLLDRAIHFCRDKNYTRIYLWTFEGLDTARHLYEKTGFKLVKERKGKQWGTEVNEQRFELNL